MAESDSNNDLRIPRWVLAFILPAMGVFVAVARTEYRTNENEADTQRLRTDMERAFDAQNTLDRNYEARFSDMEQQIQWLCAQRARDDQESGRQGAGTCP
jgi:hypothetical protein